ncbi:MAG: DUF6929 family protein [Bacteriovoracaceae bacterium]
MKKIKLEKMRCLDTVTSTQKSRPCFVSAGSGLILHQNHFYVVADDELSLGIFPHQGDALGKFVPVMNGELPLGHRERKKAKPDFESLILLDNDRLLVLPSGSKENRHLAIIYHLDANRTEVLDLSVLYLALEKEFSELNLEGAVIKGHDLLLFQRGNGAKKENAVITVELDSFLNGQLNLKKIKHYQLGEIKKTPYSFTDAAIDDQGHLYFLAAAEASDSTFEDGAFLGAIIGRFDTSGKIIETIELEIKHKPEGLAFDHDGFFYLVTDGDDITKASVLYKGKYH